MTLTANVIRSNFVGIDTGAIVSGVLPVARGGSGVSTSTGTGNVVLSNAPMLSNVTISGSLTIAESAQVTTQGLVVKAGSNVAPSITFAGNTSSGLYMPNTNTVSIATGGVERVRIDTTGNVSAYSNVIVSGYVKQQLLNYTRQGFALSTNNFGVTYSTLSTNGLSGYITYTADGTNGDYFTVNRAGVYALCARMCVNTGTSGNTIAGFVKNGTNSSSPYLGISTVDFSSYWNEHTLNAIAALQVNDILRLNIQCVNPRALGANDASMTYTIIYLYGI